MTLCNKCELPIKFERGDFLKGTAYRWYPVNLDGSDHTDTCRREQNRIWRAYGVFSKRERTVQSEIGPQVITTESYTYKGERRDFAEYGFRTVGKDYKPNDSTALPF